MNRKAPTRKSGASRGPGKGPKDGLASAKENKRPVPAKEAKAEPAASLEPMRIAKYLARAGVASRREVERMIGEGRIAIDGKTLETPATLVTGRERIAVDGEPVAGIERTRLWLFHKPSGLVTTNRDPEGRPTVFESLPDGTPRVVSVGRLDINTEGLLLLTNDGGLARLLELPSTGWLRRYRVRAHGRVEPAKLAALKDGIAVDGILYGAIEAEIEREQGGNTWLTVAIREGKNREVKNVLGALGLQVNRLIRTSYGPFQLNDLRHGELREVKGRTLRDQLGPRLVAEAGANFDAPILNETPNRPAPKSKKPGVARRFQDRPETGRSKSSKGGGGRADRRR